MKVLLDLRFSKRNSYKSCGFTVHRLISYSKCLPLESLKEIVIRELQ